MPASCLGDSRLLLPLLPPPLLLLLLLFGLSGGSSADPAVTTKDASQSQASSLTKMQAGLLESPPEPMTTAQTVNWQTQGSSSDHLTLGRRVSAPGPDLATQEFKETTKDNITFMKYEALLPGVSGTSVEKNITLDSATRIELSCILDKKYSYLQSQVTWKKGNETIRYINKTENSWSIKLQILDSSNMGSYSCAVKSKEEISAEFHLQVPKIEGREKPIITYGGDTAIMMCKSSGYTPIAWTWYIINGSEQTAINASLAEKYVINSISANVTHLKILNLTEEDDGEYCCKAAFELGESKARLRLRVLSFMVPLKPFLAIVTEAVILVTLIFLHEIYSKKKENYAEDEKEFDQVEQLKSEDSNGLENSSARHRRI